MFKKLKDKIAEEVKSSPQRVQQLAQAVVQGATSSSPSVDESNFTISEEGDKEDSFSTVPLKNSSPSGRLNRRGSNSSQASDVSFLPAFEPNTNFYHLQVKRKPVRKRTFCYNSFFLVRFGCVR